ncbi:MAG: GMC family oxidoreductase N-terminal domain-containing protein [Myxococcota bacterium]|nr:GMC family oxidoreductase N-terminal domain-containing protein [Myxococcota bacterium]
MRTEYDYIVVGGGSSGCIVAAELAKNPQVQVLLLEGGPSAEDHPETLAADGYKEAFINDSVMGERFSTPQPHAAKNRVYAGTGTVLGGSGSVNGMVYTRGSKLDYDEWPTGWKWDDVVPDFEAVESILRPNRRPPTDWTSACISAAETQGFRHRPDLNNGDLSNVIGYEWMSYEGTNRRSSYVAFIKDRGSLPNLEVLTAAHVQRILFSEGQRATGVRFEQSGDTFEVAATREIVLCTGALETPKLLQLSGVGPSDLLRSFDIPVVADRPQVGMGLHDHPNVPVFFKSREEVDCIYPQLYSFFRTNTESDLPTHQSDTCYVYWPAKSAMRHMIQRMLPPMVVPHAMYGPRARSMVRGMVGAAFKIRALQAYTDRIFGIVLILGKPKSRGSLRIQSSDSRRQALIDPAYYSDPEDMETMVKGVQLARSIGYSDPLQERGATELMPGKRVQSDKAIRKYIAKNTITTYHFAGTCAMGETETHVADLELKVRGVRGLRVADASAIPWTPVSALNAPSMMIGYRAAAFMHQP